jgi:hypothetical protein
MIFLDVLPCHDFAFTILDFISTDFPLKLKRRMLMESNFVTTRKIIPPSSPRLCGAWFPPPPTGGVAFCITPYLNLTDSCLKNKYHRTIATGFIVDHLYFQCPCRSRSSIMVTTDETLAGKYPAKNHAKRVGTYLRSHGYTGDGVIYLEAQKTRLIEDNDEPVPFRYVNSSLYPLC